MGFRKPMDCNSITHQVYMAGVELNTPYNDGFTQWEIKKDLYQLKWLVDTILADSPTFSDEENFLKDNEKKVVWKKLKQ